MCTTQKNTTRIQDIIDDCCSNCGKWGEGNKHLNKCPDPGQVKLFRYGVRYLNRWMKRRNQTDPELAFWINEYLLHRGQEQMTNLATLHPMSPVFWEVAEIQDEIGWCKFLQGKVSTKIQKLQGAHCILAGTNINGHDWMKHFIQQLVEISHTQWLYPNFTLQHYAKGYLHQRTVNKISRDVELLAATRPSDIPQESRYLLEIPQQPLHYLSPAHKV